MTRDTLKEDIATNQIERNDRLTTSRMILELKKYNVCHNKDFDERLIDYVAKLHDLGVAIGQFISSSRRIVFKGKLDKKDVVIKFCHSKHTLDHDERQQQTEEDIWNRAQKEGDSNFFARIYFSDHASEFIVQEWCENVIRAEREDLSPEMQTLIDKYALSEIEVGNDPNTNQAKFVDYGY